jgi:copper transport protein
VLAALLLLCLLAPSTADAHAVVVRTDPPDGCSPRAATSFARGGPCPGGAILPSAPPAVRIWFSEPVEPVAGGIAVLAPSGKRVERRPARAEGAELAVELDAAEEGTYLVSWRVVAEDTHAARGGFAFSVGRASPPAADPGGAGEVGSVAPLGLALQVAARWLHFLGYALGFGGLAFRAFVLRAPPPPVDRRLWRLVELGVVALLLAEPLALLAQTTSLGADAVLDPAVVGDALGSSFGRALGQRLAAALLLWTLVGIARERGDCFLWPGLALGVALGALDGGSAHAASFRPVALGLLVNAVHLAAMGVWVGGLAALLVVWRPLGGARRSVSARFGRVAATALGVLAVSGAAMALVHLGAPLSGLATAYGAALLGKLAALAAVVLLAWLAVGRARRWRALEAAGLTAVLALAGLLVSLPPPR